MLSQAWLAIHLCCVIGTPTRVAEAPSASSEAPSTSSQVPHSKPQHPPARRGTTQIQLDLFDFLSPGYGAWVNHVRHRSDGRPRWQIGVAGGMFNHYDRGERRTHGWGHAQDQRFYGRVSAAGYLWRGLFVGGQAEFMVRRVTQRRTSEARTRMFPTLQPLIGYNLHPWGWGRGRFSVMAWVAPRVILLQHSLNFSDGESVEPPGWVEFSSGLNIGVDL